MSSVDKYLDGTDLSNSTAVYDNALLTIKSPAGYYSDGTIVREQVNGKLLPASICPPCVTPLPCAGTTQFPQGSEGVYQFTFDVGNTPQDVGAIIISFVSYNFPDGVKATYDGVVYNGLTSNTSSTGGWKQSTNAGNRTYIGSSISACSAPTLPYSATVNLYNYQSSSTWDPAVGTTTLNVASGDLQLESADTGTTTFTMVIPKLNATPNLVAFDIASYCTNTNWDLTVTCPTNLPSFTMGIVKNSASTACNHTTGAVGYRAGGGNTGNTPLLYDLVFSNSSGSNKLSAGFYGYSGGYFEVDANGVIVNLGSCPP